MHLVTKIQMILRYCILVVVSPQHYTVTELAQTWNALFMAECSLTSCFCVSQQKLLPNLLLCHHSFGMTEILCRLEVRSLPLHGESTTNRRGILTITTFCTLFVDADQFGSRKELDIKNKSIWALKIGAHIHSFIVLNLVAHKRAKRHFQTQHPPFVRTRYFLFCEPLMWTSFTKKTTTRYCI